MIRFHYINTSFAFLHRKQLKRFLIFLFRNERFAIDSIRYIFCDDNYLLKLNQRFLAHDTLTDIITFRLSEVNSPIEAEIYISVDRVIDNAKIFSKNFQFELQRVVFHGALHLCGYLDKTEDQTSLMRGREDYYIQKFLRFT